MLCYKKYPSFRKPGTVPPMCSLGVQLFLFFSKQDGQIVPNRGEHRAKQELETVPPQELGAVPLLEGKK